MKKLSLVLVILLAFGASIFADDAAEVTMPTVEEAAAAIADLATVKGLLAPSLSGSATLGWGIDLDNTTTGFTGGSGSGSVSLTLVPKATASKGTVGVISIKDYQVGIKDGAFSTGAPSVDAKLVFGPLSVAVSSVPSLAVNKAAHVDTIDATPAGATGTTISYAAGDMSFALMVASAGDHTANTANEYAIGVSGSAKVSVLTLPFVFVYNLENSEMGFGVEPVVTAGPIKVTVGFDGDLTSGFGWDMDLALVYTIVTDATVTVGFDTGDDSVMNASVAFSEKSGAGEAGMLADIGASLTVALTDLTGTLAYDIDVTGDYTTASLKPYFAAGYDSAGVVPLKVGCEFYAAMTGMDNTKVVAEWSTTDIASSILGAATVMATVSY